VTAGEDQAQPVVAPGALLDRFVAGVQERGLGVPVLAGGLPAEAVDRPVLPLRNSVRATTLVIRAPEVSVALRIIDACRHRHG
jgi:hypothetical protein